MQLSRPSVNIVILNYNGEALIPECLPSILQAAQASRYPVQITVLDNHSTDNSVQLLTKSYPQVRTVLSEGNYFLCSYNDFSKKISEDIVLFLNNDIRVDAHFIDPLVKHFEENKDLFLVAPKVMSFDGSSVEAGPSKAGFKYGMFWCNAKFNGFEREADLPSATYSSGFGAFSRLKFLELGGYDTLYLPGIMEDVDLCHRAAQNGYKLVYEPKSIVYHMGQASFKKAFGRHGISTIAYRNNFLFMWKNFKGIKFWIPHLLFLLPRLLFEWFRGNTAFLAGFADALKKVGQL